MLELKTIARKADHPLLALPEAQVPPVVTPASREPNQRRMMVAALVLLLVALALVLYRDRDFWFPDNSEAEDQLEPAPVTASPTQPATATPKASTAERPAEKRAMVGRSQPKIPAVVAPAAAAPEPPMSATATRTVLPPLEVEVVAGDNRSRVNPGANSVRVDLQPGSMPRAVSNASAPKPDTAAGVTSSAAERVQMSAGAAEVVGQAVKPGYPMLARQMKVQGSVVLQALIGRDGTIQDLHVVSGPPILATAAQEAVRQWHFKPHYQGSDAVETQANITVNFTISTN
ncbi:MAG TPA: energy transducer TonB [Candidatus Sulfotelmatobacter sp.]|nr:energy transducer TonB [Candidatus Sulfotelmatobacter sp.]